MAKSLIVLSGVAGVGKSTIAKIIEESHEDCIVVSRDKIRFSMLKPDDDYFKYEDEVTREFYDQINRGMKNHEYVIADATHITLGSRNKLFNHLFIPKNTRVIGVYLDMPLETCLKQNAKRTGRAYVPENVIKNMYRNKSYPSVQKERFNEVYRLDKAALEADDNFLSRVFDKMRNL